MSHQITIIFLGKIKLNDSHQIRALDFSEINLHSKELKEEEVIKNLCNDPCYIILESFSS